MKYLTVPWLQKTQGRGGGLVSDQARSVVLVVAVLILTIVMGRGIGQGVVWPWILGTFLAWVLIWGHPLVLLSALFVTLSVFPRFNNIGPFSSLRIDELLVLPFFALTSVVPRVSYTPRREWSAAAKRFLRLLVIYASVIGIAALAQSLLRGSSTAYSRDTFVYLLKTMHLITLFVLVYDLFLQEPRLKHSALLLFVGCVMVIALLGILQQMGVGFAREFVYEYFTRETGGYVRYSRATSVFGANGTIFGAFLTMSALFLLCLAITYPPGAFRNAALVAMGICSIALILTAAKMAIIAFGIGALLIFVLMYQKRGKISFILLALVSILGVLIYYNIPEEVISQSVERIMDEEGIESSTQLRADVWEYRLRRVFSSITTAIFGYGVDVPGVTESQYVFELWKKGLLGLASYLAWGIVALQFFWIAYRRSASPSDRGLALGFFMVIISVHVMGGAYAPFQAPRLREWYVILLAMGYALLPEAGGA